MKMQKSTIVNKGLKVNMLKVKNIVSSSQRSCHYTGEYRDAAHM